MVVVVVVVVVVGVAETIVFVERVTSLRALGVELGVSLTTRPAGRRAS